ncbi:MAG: hypothetical protein NTY11_00310 [Candidatus Parcubacteria bacterium]|nr:hypothetical protein [Candidatus Parcubacteria bacterium]
MNQKINRSASKHIRQEKARIRREVSDSVKKDEMIKQLYSKFNPVVLEKTISEEKAKIQTSKKPSKKDSKKVSKK